ncbi:MAG TPA: SDR family oxidoreductase [Jatrophihabitantaceae bacterium]|nr:SDR family oxidoreductase [Jatrophihabitantaceae bacterium]
MAARRFEGKVAIVTGGGSGIGAATARRLAEEGAQVGVGDVNGELAEKVAAEIGDAAIAVEFDAGDVASVERLVSTTVNRFGRLNVLHNNAAIMAPDHIAQDTNPVDIPFEIWDRTFAVNVRGYLAGVKYAVPHMLEAGGGAIVMTVSGSAKLGDLGAIAYAASKGAIGIFIKSVATIYGKQGIRCNGINPGLIRTEGGRRNVHGAMVDIQLRNTLTPRLGEAEDIAAAVAYLASDEAAFVTGAILDVDGGMLCHMPYMTDVLEAYGTGMAFGDPAPADDRVAVTA